MVIVVRTGGAVECGIFLPPPSVITVNEGAVIWCLALLVDAHVDGDGAVTAFEPNGNDGNNDGNQIDERNAMVDEEEQGSLMAPPFSDDDGSSDGGR